MAEFIANVIAVLDDSALAKLDNLNYPAHISAETSGLASDITDSLGKGAKKAGLNAGKAIVQEVASSLTSSDVKKSAGQTGTIIAQEVAGSLAAANLQNSAEKIGTNVGKNLTEGITGALSSAKYSAAMAKAQRDILKNTYDNVSKISGATDKQIQKAYQAFLQADKRYTSAFNAEQKIRTQNNATANKQRALDSQAAAKQAINESTVSAKRQILLDKEASAARIASQKAEFKQQQKIASDAVKQSAKWERELSKLGTSTGKRMADVITPRTMQDYLANKYTTYSPESGYTAATVKAAGVVNAAGQEFQKFNIEAKNADGTVRKYTSHINTLTGEVYELNKGLYGSTSKNGNSGGGGGNSRNNGSGGLVPTSTSYGLENNIQEWDTERRNRAWQSTYGSSYDSAVDRTLANGGAYTSATMAGRYAVQTQKIREVGNALTDVSGAAAKYVALPIAAATVASVKAFTDYETAFTGVRKTVDGTDEELQAVSDGIEEMALRVPVASTELAGIAQIGGQLGVPTKSLLNYTEAFAAMQVATNLQGEEGASTLARLMNVLNEDYDHVENVGSAIVDLGNHTATTESDIAHMATRMGSSASIIGMSTADVLGYSAALSALGVEAEMGGSAMTRIWQNIDTAVSENGDDLEAYAKVAKTSAKDFAKAWKDNPTTAFNSLLEGLSESEDIIGDLGDLGVNNIRDIQALEKLAGRYDLVKDSLNRANTAYAENTALQTEADRAYDTTASKLKMAKESVIQAGRGIGEALAPTVVKAADSVKDLASDFANLDDSTQESLIKTALWSAGSIAAVNLTGKALNGISTIRDGFGTLFETSGGALGLSKLGKAGLIIAGIAAAAVVGKKAYDAWYDSEYNWGDGLEEQTDTLSTAVDQYKELDKLKNEYNGAKKTLSNPFSTTEELDAAQPKIDGIRNSLSEEFGFSISADTTNLDGAFELQTAKTRYDVLTSGNTAREDLRETSESYSEANTSKLKEYQKTLSDSSKKMMALEKLQADIQSFELKYPNPVSSDEYKNALQGIKDEYTDYWSTYGEGMDKYRTGEHLSSYEMFSNTEGPLIDARNEADKAEKHMFEIMESRAKWKAALESARESYSELMAMDAQNGDKDNLAYDEFAFQDLGITAKKAGEATDAIARSYAKAKTGYTDLQDVISNGKLSEAAQNIVDYDKSIDNFGDSTIANAALLKNGFEGVTPEMQNSQEAIQGVVNDMKKLNDSNNETKYNALGLTAAAKNELGISGDNLAKAVSVSMTGASSLEEVFGKGGTALDSLISTYMEVGEASGLAVDEVITGAALMKEGFSDVSDVSEKDLGKVLQNMRTFGQKMNLDMNDSLLTQFAQHMGLISDDKHVETGTDGTLNVAEGGKAENNSFQKSISNLQTLTEGTDEYNTAAKQAATEGAKQIATSINSGDYQGAENAINDLSAATSGASESARSFAAANAAAGKQGIGSLEEVFSQGGEALDNTISDYLKLGEQFGLTSEDVVVGAALMKEGFTDISQVGEKDLGKVLTNLKQFGETSGLAITADTLNGLAHSIGLLGEGQTLKINADGTVTWENTEPEVDNVETNGSVNWSGTEPEVNDVSINGTINWQQPTQPAALNGLEDNGFFSNSSSFGDGGFAFDWGAGYNTLKENKIKGILGGAQESRVLTITPEMDGGGAEVEDKEGKIIYNDEQGETIEPEEKEGTTVYNDEQGETVEPENKESTVTVNEQEGTKIEPSTPEAIDVLVNEAMGTIAEPPTPEAIDVLVNETMGATVEPPVPDAIEVPVTLVPTGAEFAANGGFAGVAEGQTQTVTINYQTGSTPTPPTGLTTTGTINWVNAAAPPPPAGLTTQGTINWVNAAAPPPPAGLTAQGTINWVNGSVPESPTQNANGTVNYSLGSVAVPNGQTATGTINYALGSVAVPNGMVATGTINYVLGSVATPGNASVTGTASADGTAHSRGTAFADGTTGRAFKSGDWGVKTKGIALGGELGEELVVRNGRYFTIGENSAEFFQHKPGDIIFNAEQTREIFEKGKITKGKRRGKAFASGSNEDRIAAIQTALTTGDASGLQDRSTDKNAGSSSGSGSGSGSGEDETYFDWIEVIGDRIERLIDKFTDKFENTFISLQKRFEGLGGAVEETKKLIEHEQKAYDEYISQADAIGLDEEWVTKIKEGDYSIDSVSDETLKKNIQRYQEYYENALDAQDKIDELSQDIAELYEDNFNTIQDTYEAIIDGTESISNLLEEYADRAEERGFVGSTKYYEYLRNNELKNLSELENEKVDLTNALNDAVNEGNIEEYSESWYELKNEINDVTEAIEKSKTALYEYDNEMRDTLWDRFDYMQSSIENFSKETDFLIDLMGDDDELYDKSGLLTDKGEAALGLHGLNYNVSMAQANAYGEEADKIFEELKNDKGNDELIQRRQELLEKQRESILAAKEEKEAMVDLVKNGIDEQIDSLKDLIDEYEESLDSAKDLYDYQQKIKEHTKDIASLEKQLAAYENDDSEETKAKVQQIKLDLEEARDELQETEYDRYISDQKELLESLYDKYDEAMEDKFEDVDATVENLIDHVNSNSSSIESTLRSETSKVGTELSYEMDTVWTSESNALSSYFSDGGIILNNLQGYFDNTNASITGVNNTLTSIMNGVNSIVSLASFQADVDVDEDGAVSKMKQNSIDWYTSDKKSSLESENEKYGKALGYTKSNGSWYTQTGKLAYEVTVSDLIDEMKDNSDAWYSASASEQSSLANKNVKLAAQIAAKTGENVYKDGDGVWWIGNKKLYSYKTGGLADYTGAAWLDGTKSSPEMVLDAQDTENFLSLRDTLDAMKSQGLSLKDFGAANIISVGLSGLSDMTSMTSSLGQSSQADTSNKIESININIPIDHVEDYNDFVSQLQKDKKFEKFVRSMSIDLLSGGSTLAKNKYTWR